MNAPLQAPPPLHSPLAQRLRDVAAAMAHPESNLWLISPSSQEGAQVPAPSIGRIVELPKIPDPRGNLTFIEGEHHVPFDIKRVYYLYDVPGGAQRGGHAHKALHQLIIAIAGSFDVLLDNGTNAERISLNRSYYGLYVPTMTWREIENFSSGAVCLVLASEHYDESDYYRQYDKFLDAVKAST